jgi:hypothetical protein
MRQVGIVALMLVVGILTIGGLICISPKYTALANRKTTFVLDRSFEDMRKSLSQGRFEEEILKSNNATMVSKTWHRSDLRIQRPLSKDRYWEFNGVMTARVQVDHPQAGQFVVDMRHKLHVAKDSIEIEANLERPLEVGITDLRERIVMYPNGPNQTVVELEIGMKLQRIVPSFMREYAQTQLNNAADRSITNLQQVLQNLPPPKKGLVIPLHLDR